MRCSVLVPAVLVPAFVTAGCSVKTSDRDLVYLNPYQAVEKTNATPGIFEREVRTAWVDPRRPEQYAAEHIPGAISLPFPRIPAEAKTVLKGYDQFVVYDTDFDDTIGKAAAKRLMEEGFSDVYSLEGGLKAWKRDGNPTDKAPAAPPAEKKQPGTSDAKSPATTPAAAPATKPAAPAAAPPASVPPATAAKPATPPSSPASTPSPSPSAAPPKD